MVPTPAPIPHCPIPSPSLSPASTPCLYNFLQSLPSPAYNMTRHSRFRVRKVLEMEHL